MKLELKHLAGYLPYGLKVIFESKGGRILEVTGLRMAGVSEQTSKLIYFNSISETLNIEYFKPILRPLSDLTKKIEVNGEKFVPILELYKMRTQHMTDKIDKYYVENDTAILKLEELTTPDGNISFIHYFEIDIESERVHFSICTETVDNIKDEIIEERFGFIGNEFNMLQKLYEWHFDIHGLIEQNLAIDKNTLS